MTSNRTALVAVALWVCCGVGCAPFTVALKSPPARPDLDPPPAPLMRPTLDPSDCQRFRLLEGQWQRQSWDPSLPLPELVTTSIQPGDPHPAAPLGLSECRHVAIPVGWWILGKEAITRYPLARYQADELERYNLEVLTAWEAESRRLAEAGQEAQRAQWRTFALGLGVGGASVAAVVLGIVLGAR